MNALQAAEPDPLHPRRAGGTEFPESPPCIRHSASPSAISHSAFRIPHLAVTEARPGGSRILPTAAALLASLFLFCAPGRAEVTVQATVDRNVVGVNDPFIMTVVVSGAGMGVSDPRIPQVTGLGFAAAGRSQNVSIVNGSMTQSVVFNYQVTATSPGKHVIPSVAVVTGGKTYATDPIQITASVRAPGSGTTAPAVEGPPPVKVTAEAGKRRAYVGEQVPLVIRFFNRAQLASQPSYSPPDTAGFLVEDLPGRNYQGTSQGVAYAVAELRYSLFGTSPGNPVIGPAVVQATVAERDAADPFGMFFRRGRTFTLKTDPIPMVVLPLPDSGKPAGFRGAVGSFTVRSSVDRTSVEAGTPVTLTFEVSGRGLIRSLKEPEWPALPSARRYETVSDVNMKKTADAVAGTKTFRTVIVPQSPGKLTIPGMSYPFFDPEARKYVAARTAPITLDVKPGKGGTSTSQVPGLPGKATESDIRFIKARYDLAPVAEPLPLRPRFWALQGLPALLLIAGLASSFRRRVLLSDPSAVRAAGARRAASRRLKAAGALAKAGKKIELHAAVHEALTGFLADRWRVSASGLTLNAAEARLREKGADDALLKRLRETWEQSDLVRYAPMAASGREPGEVLAAAGRLMADLEKFT